MHTTHRYFLGCLTAAILLHISPLQAQERLTLSKETAVALALQNNMSLAAARITVEQAEARRTQAGRLSNPELKIDYANDRTFNNEGEYRLGIGFEQKFPVTKRLSLLKQIADIEIELAQSEIQNHERYLRREVETNVLIIAQTTEQIELRESQILILQQLAEFVESRVRIGEASNFEVNQIKLELFSVHEEIHELENDRTEEIGHLRHLLGLALDTPLQIDYAYTKPKAAKQLPTVTDSLLREHPAIRQKRLLAQIAGSQTTWAMANRWEDITVGLFLNNNRGVDQPIGRKTDNFLGLTLKVPMPIHNNNQGRIAERRLQQRQFELELEALVLEKRSSAHTLEIKMTNLYKQIDEYEAEVTELVDQNLRDMNDAYESGLISLTELFRTQEQRLKIEIFQLTLLHDYEQSLVDWTATTNLKAQGS
ncbi:MAG: TolC family protein [Opitutales bacterium]|nr:TolC family protein [Opitutales bacterium]